MHTLQCIYCTSKNTSISSHVNVAALLQGKVKSVSLQNRYISLQCPLILKKLQQNLLNVADCNAQWKSSGLCCDDPVIVYAV